MRAGRRKAARKPSGRPTARRRGLIDPHGRLWRVRAAVADRGHLAGGRVQRCKTRASLPLDAIRRPRDTPLWKLEGSLKCRSCRKGCIAPQARDQADRDARRPHNAGHKSSSDTRHDEEPIVRSSAYFYTIALIKENLPTELSWAQNCQRTLGLSRRSGSILA